MVHVIFRSLFRTPATPAIKQIAPAEAHARQAAGAVIVDVREPNEWREGHIAGALHLPLARIGQLGKQVAPEQEVILVCRSGNRSAAAAGALLQAGYADVSNLSGGMLAWQRRRLPVTR